MMFSTFISSSSFLPFIFRFPFLFQSAFFLTQICSSSFTRFHKYKTMCSDRAPQERFLELGEDLVSTTVHMYTSQMNGSL